MRRARHALLVMLLCVVAGCGGGGGGDSRSPGGSPGPARQQADLKGANASLFAEVFRNFLTNDIAALDEAVSGFNNDIPVLTVTDTQRTEACGTSGNLTFTAAGSGADLSLQYDACVEFGVTINGRVAFNFSNVNATTRSFDFRLTYTNLSFTAGSSGFTLNGTTTMQTQVTNDAHIHRLVVNQTMLDTGLATTFTAESLSATVQHARGNYDAVAVTAATGSLGVSGRGFADANFRVASNDTLFTGVPGSQISVTLDGVSFGMRYEDAQGRQREVAIPIDEVINLDVLDGRNAAPTISFIPDLVIDSGKVQQLDLRPWVFDEDFEAVDVTLAVTGAPGPQSTLQTLPLAAGRFELRPSDSGVFTLRATAVDPLGLRAEQDFTVTVRGDTDKDGLFDDVDSDDDNDGVADGIDALPLDPSESRDADRDGIGDNADTDDDNDGVADALDAFPFDPACSSASQGNGQECFLSAIEDFDSLIAIDGVLHFVSMADKTIHRWDSATDSFLAAWSIGTAVPTNSTPTSVAHVPAHDRIYVGFDNGAITAVDAYAGSEQAFATLPSAVGGLADAGNFLLAQDDSGAWETHYTFAADGALRWSAEWNHYSRVYAFNPAEERVYFFRDTSSPNDLHYEQIDQTTGVRSSAGETPYHGAYGIDPPIVPSATGDRILIGSGNLFSAGALSWAAAIPGAIYAAQWDAADGLIVLRPEGSRTSLERRDAALAVVEQVTFDGQPRGIAPALQGYVIVTELQDRLVLHRYHASNDTDADGVSNTVDDFPLDIAASVDTDFDGYPDAWNGGRSQADSTTGLMLDAYPTESACHLPQHGDGTTCNVESTLPDYFPDAVAGDGDGIVYLLSAQFSRVYRYSAVAARHLSPIVVGDASPPSYMEYAPEHDRLYFGYPSGAVTYVDLHDAQLRERPFVNVAANVGGLGAAGEYLAVQDASGAWGTHYYFDQTGLLRDSADWNYYSRDYEWNSALQRLFFLRDSMSPSDLHFEALAPDGTIAGVGETPYHGSYQIQPPIVMSPDDQYVMLGSGDIYDAADLTWYRSLLNDFVTAIWDDNGTITAVEDTGSATRIHRYNANFVWQGEENRAGTPLALLGHAGGYVLVTHDGSKPVFSPLAR